ncbi:hypothetical protein MRS44_010601 [Fusarium solani]|uniref:uncharacterized protein n=1 Tax=Fusarium solani TaxID=169388 RepID=UPI0032C439E6|nr:hypothetical protein MRS44_010601 [Fusarium solani]
MDVQDWQASRLRIRNSRYLQDGNVKPWPWSIQVQILGAEGSGRHSLLDRICLDEFIPNDDPFTERDSACKQTNLRGLTCNVWFETPTSLTSHGGGFALSKQELFYWLTRGMRDCDALILVYDLTDPSSFRELCEFCARCELEGVGVAPGSSLPCLVVGTKADLPNQEHVHDGERLAKRLGGRFVTCSSRTGEGFPELMEAAIGPVVDARTALIQESEDMLGQAIRALLAWAGEKRTGLRKRLSKRKRASELRRPVSRPRCTGAPPRWTMRSLISLPLCQSLQGMSSFDSENSEASLLVPCPPEWQLSVDLVEPAATDWAPRF